MYILKVVHRGNRKGKFGRIATPYYLLLRGISEVGLRLSATEKCPLSLPSIPNVNICESICQFHIHYIFFCSCGLAQLLILLRTDRWNKSRGCELDCFTILPRSVPLNHLLAVEQTDCWRLQLNENCIGFYGRRFVFRAWLGSAEFCSDRNFFISTLD